MECTVYRDNIIVVIYYGEFVGLPENGESRYGKHDTGIHHLNHIFCKVLKSDSSVV